jgi:hypothetical protein
VNAARGRLARYGPLYFGGDSFLISALMLPLYRRGEGAMRDYRAWTIEQLAAATDYVLGPEEPMLAGETALVAPESVTGSWKRDLAVAVTAAHVLIFRIDSFDGQPRWIALAARAPDVTIETRPLLEAMFHGPALTVSGRNAQWVIRGSPGVFKPDAVIGAWRQAASANGPVS